jgi:hypothetical protein
MEFSEKVIGIINQLWVNQAWAAVIAKAVFEDYVSDFEKAYWLNSDDAPIINDYTNRLNYKFEAAPYDEFE